MQRIFALSVLLFSCGAGTGVVQIVLTAESTITDGLDPGGGEDDVQDGWTVRYDKVLVSIGRFEARAQDGALALSDEGRVYVADMMKLGTDGAVLATWRNASAERYQKFSYALMASDAPERAGEIADLDFEQMVQNGYVLYVEGSITKAAKTVRFALGYKGATVFGECAAEEGGPSGFAVVDRGSVAVRPTIHGDHWFFDGDPHSTTPRRLAEWLAKSDLDDDGLVTRDELTRVQASAVFGGYNLSGLPVTPIQTAFHFFGAMVRTSGHFGGDGDCEDVRVLSLDPDDPPSLAIDEESEDTKPF